MKTLNAVYSPLSTRRRYEVWFIRLGLADLSGAWWFRYLLMNPGRGGCPGNARGMPVQVWTTWFPQGGKPQSFIQGYPLDKLGLSGRGENSFHFRVENSEITDDSCHAELAVDAHRISWDLHYSSSFGTTLSNKGWIGFSRTPHSDARFSGKIRLNGQNFEGNPLGFGVQGHNCGYRHRSCWRWAHAYFLRPNRPPSTLEALVYDMPFGLIFRKAVLWHEGKQYVFKNLREINAEQDKFAWDFRAPVAHGVRLEAAFDGSGTSIHRIPYLKTDCSGTFEVTNNSLAKATLRLKLPDGRIEELQTENGAVLEMAGRLRYTISARK
jgi:hypothetical protein